MTPLSTLSPHAFATLVNQLLTGVPGAVMPDIEALVGEIRRRLADWPQSLEGGAAQPVKDRHDFWAVTYLHDWDPDGKIYPELSCVYATWQEAQEKVNATRSPDKYHIVRAHLSESAFRALTEAK